MGVRLTLGVSEGATLSVGDAEDEGDTEGLGDGVPERDTEAVEELRALSEDEEDAEAV